MDKLKYIKLENEDGSYSSSIPLAVDGDYVNVNGNTLTDTVKTLATKSEVEAIASGGPAGVYSTVTALTTADPDHSKIYVVTENGHWYYYNNEWQDGGVYQATEIADNSITNEKIINIEAKKVNEIFEKNFINLLNKDECILGIYVNASNTFYNGYTTYAGYKLYGYTSNYIPCRANDNFIKNWFGVGVEITFFDENKNYISGMTNSNLNFTIPNNNNIKYFRHTIPVYSDMPGWYDKMIPLEKAMIIKGSSLPKKYIPFKKTYIKDLTSITKMPTPVIFDTDWFTDVDDAVAGGILVEAEKAGLVDIVAIVSSATSSKTIGSLDAFFTYLGRPNLAIGANKNQAGPGWTGTWVSYINDNYPHTLTSDTAENAINTYRRALTNTSIPINILVVGSLRNIYNLLLSEADEISNLTGYELVAKKVNKIYVMGGTYPSGSEANFREGVAANYVCSHCPTEMVFLGFEVGNTVISGGTILDRKDYDIVAEAIDHYLEATPSITTQGRSSWDPMLVLLGCIENFDECGYDIVYGANTVNENTGANTFIPSSNNIYKKQCYVVKNKPDKWYEHQLNDILEKHTFPTRKNIGQQQIERIVI